MYWKASAMDWMKSSWRITVMAGAAIDAVGHSTARGALPLRSGMAAFAPLLSSLWFLLSLPARLPALRRSAVRAVLARQLLFTAWQGLGTVLLVGGAAGMILGHQIQGVVGGSGELTLRIAASAVFLEVAPLLTGIVIVARSGSAVAAELAAMQVHGELRSLKSMGMAIDDYLVLPRVLAGLAAGLCLGLHLALMALLGVSLAIGDGGPTLHLVQTLDGSLLGQCLGKSAVFGAWCMATTCCLGLSAGYAQTAVPVAASRAVITAILGLFALDGLFALAGAAGAALA
jgi:phospholipid/cholesterol/gamma-HCH transport system permease protein